MGYEVHVNGRFTIRRVERDGVRLTSIVNRFTKEADEFLGFIPRGEAVRRFVGKHHHGWMR